MTVGWRDGRLVDGVSTTRTSDDAWGAFTTVGCDRGQPLLWGRHRRRLAGSLKKLGAGSSINLPTFDALAEVLAANELSGPARLRVVGRQVSESEWQVEASAAAVHHKGPAAPPQSLIVFRWPASPPAAGHKLLARRAWDAARDRAVAAGGDDALIVDGDERVYETSVANVWAVFGDRVLTPPAPARCLPGVMRGWLTQHLGKLGLEVREHELTLADVARADEMWTSNAVVGVRRVRRVAEWQWREWPVYERLADLGLPAPSWPDRAVVFGSR